MKAGEMQIGQQCTMQRGPTRNPRRVTLLDKEAPSGKSHWVLVRLEDGVSAGKQIEAPSISLQHLPGAKPPRKALAKKAPAQPAREVPPDWKPKVGEAVAWTQTLGSRCKVLSVEAERGVARIRGKVMGVWEEFDASVGQLSPFARELAAVPDEELASRLEGRLPEKRQAQGKTQPIPTPVSEVVDEEWIERLIFSPGCIGFYRRRFAKRSSLQDAERKLREELRGAEKLRKRHTGEYLRLRVQGRFDAVLWESPSSGEFQALYVNRLELPAKAKRKKSRRRKAA